MKLAAKRGEQERSLGGVGLGERVEGGFEELDLLGVNLAERCEIATAVGNGRSDHRVSVSEVSGEPRCRQQRLPIGRDPCLLLGGTQPDEKSETKCRFEPGR